MRKPADPNSSGMHLLLSSFPIEKGKRKYRQYHKTLKNLMSNCDTGSGTPLIKYKICSFFLARRLNKNTDNKMSAGCNRMRYAGWKWSVWPTISVTYLDGKIKIYKNERDFCNVIIMSVEHYLMTFFLFMSWCEGWAPCQSTKLLRRINH